MNVYLIEATPFPEMLCGAAAAGCTIRGPFAEARRKILRAIGDAVPDCSLSGLRAWQTEQ